MLAVMMAILEKENLVMNINIFNTLSYFIVQLCKSKLSIAFLDNKNTVRSNK